MTTVSFQGVAGAYSEEAVRQFFGAEANALPCDGLADVFQTVESGAAQYGMLPVENSVAGSVNHSYELLMEHDLRIHAEVVLRVRHMLLGVGGAKLSDVAVVRSHPQALAQCARYLERHGLRREPADDTAGAAQGLAAHPERHVGVIASEWAAELFGLEVLDRGIEDSHFNYTRFFVLSVEDAPRSQRNKTSLVFSTPHRPGALYDCLGEFAKRRISLSKLESRPRLNRPWQYIFYLDFEGHSQDPECEAALMGLLRRSSFVKMLGSYPAATTPLEDADVRAAGPGSEKGERG